mgnify:CR=1 FL=1
MPRTHSSLSIWTVTDDKIGMLNQALGLAEAIGSIVDNAEITKKRVCPNAPWRWIPPVLWAPGITGIGNRSDLFEPPWPDIIISCGRHAIRPTLAVKRKSGGKTYIIHVQHPHIPISRYDLIAAPYHDRLKGANVVQVQGAMHRITPDLLRSATAAFEGVFDKLPSPRVAVMIGGTNRVFRMTPETTQELGRNLLRIIETAGASLMVTTSRRTGERNETILKKLLTPKNIFFWDNQGLNPYFAYLALADAIVVTGDSVNMISEAASTGKPIYITPLEGDDSKFSAFHQMLYDAGIARPFAGNLETWSYPPLEEPKRVAEIALRRLEAEKN